MKIPPFRLERYFDQYEFKVRHLLSSSDCQSMSINALLAMEPGASEAFGNTWLGYTEAPGHPALREAIANLYSDVSPEDVLVHAGAEEAIFNAMHVLISPGDHIIVQSPCYQSLAEVARSAGAEVTAWSGDQERGWSFDLGNLKQLLRPETKLVVINNPHNPTGALMSKSDFAELVALSQQHGFLLFSDEVYRSLESSSELKLPSLCEVDESGLALGVMSKTYGLAGLRIGWIVTKNRSVYSALTAMKDYTSICNSAPSEFLATVALKHADTLADINRKIIHNNLELLDDFFCRNEDLFQWRRPQAGPIAFPKYLRGAADGFCRKLVDEAGVMLLPGSLYGADFASYFRVGFGRTSMPEALLAFEKFLR
ncbi:aminotransferase class I/II-fold pyridoxal phosphate-dependent enzyme [bacterium]|nr:aminotransferase class I/II-fold pyridoxal phosphate-dependent enzyme [bacterium]